MLKQFLAKECVHLDAEAKSPEEAIRLAGLLLVKAGKVKPSYVDAMVEGFQTFGPYIVVAPSIAIPHARPEHGVLETCVSFIRLKKPIPFHHPANDPVQLIFSIGGGDPESHLILLQSLASLLGIPQHVEELKKVRSYEELVHLLDD